jgi:hypothetical protein
VEVDYQEIREITTDPGGILSLDTPPNSTASIRLTKRGQ